MQSQQSPPEWTDQTNLSQSIRLKQQGNIYFKQKNYKSALKQYHQAILHLGGIIDKSSSMAMYTKTASQQISNETNLIKYSIWLNMSQIYIFQQKYEKGLDILKKCQQLINNQQFPKSYNKNLNRPKLHYRKGICYMKLNYFQQARTQFNKLKLLDPSFNNEIQQFEQEIKINQKRQNQKAKKMYQGFFK